jgi:hypothetical protein
LLNAVNSLMAVNERLKKELASRSQSNWLLMYSNFLCLHFSVYSTFFMIPFVLVLILMNTIDLWNPYFCFYLSFNIVM